ncbi:MAG: sulfatase [Gemmatimonadota bacterium]|nr:MAG: sulfatase [Gemmatimonadota bacterium]
MSRQGKINRRKFLGKCAKASGAAFMLSVLPKAQSSQSQKISKGKDAPSQRNILLLISDDHGIDQLGCYGNAKIHTPNLDRMAKQGVKFTNAFSVAASCSASRGSILSGLYTHQNGQFGHQHNWHHFSYHSWVQSLPSLLKDNGYQTGLVGKLHVAPKEQIPFDFVISGRDIMGNRDVKTMADKAGEFFNQDKRRPFFLLVGYSDPHRSAQGMTQMKGVENFSGFGNHQKYPGVDPVKYKPDDVHVPSFLPDTPEVREELADQYQSITRLDTGIGMVMENLRKSGRYEETLIIYISDNGIPFPGAKTTIYDSGVHLPMLVCSPQIESGGKVTNAMVSFIDLVPTLLDWAGTQGPEYTLPGRSFLPVLNQKDPPGWDEVYHSHTFHEITMYYPMRAVRTRRYKYIRNLFPELEYPFATDLFVSKTWQGILKRKSKLMGKRKVSDYLLRPAEELYDLERDPDEAINVVDDPAYEKVLEEMRSKLKKMREETDDPWLITENYRANQTLY